MTSSYRIIREQKLVLVTFRSRVADSGFVELWRDVYADPDYELGMDEWIDLRAIDSFQVSSQALAEVEELVRRRYRASAKEFKSACIAPQDLVFGLGRAYEALTEDGPETFRVFRTTPPALAWLGIDQEILKSAG